MLENRRHFRLREILDVAWKVKDQEVSGEGVVINISRSGLLLQTDRVFQPSDKCILTIEPSGEVVPFAPKKGQMMWFQRIRTPQERFLCGVQFLADYADSNFQEWLEMKVNRLSEAGDAKILGNMAY